MPPYEELFLRLQDLGALLRLIDTTEDLHLDCKIWPSREDDAQRIVAKALCGFANADGGVLLIGFDARSMAKGDPDVIRAAVPVEDILFVKSRIENLVGELVEPRLQGVKVATIPETAEAKSGFVLVMVPPTNGFPCRSRKTRDFYQRISAGTYPMEYYQIADMFGKRRRPVLTLWVEEGRYRLDGQIYERELTIGIENRGRAVARFPSLRFARIPGLNINLYGIDGNGNFGLPMRPTEPEIVVFGGGIDDVIYPGSSLKIAKLDHRASATGWVRAGDLRPQMCFQALTFNVELSADEMLTDTQSTTIPEREIL